MREQFPLTSNTDKRCTRCLIASPSNCPVWLTRALPSLLNSSTTNGCQPPSDSLARGTKVIPCVLLSGVAKTRSVHMKTWHCAEAHDLACQEPDFTSYTSACWYPRKSGELNNNSSRHTGLHWGRVKARFSDCEQSEKGDNATETYLFTSPEHTKS